MSFTPSNTTAGIGDLVAAKYQLLRLLGRGSTGDVWLATHRALGEDVALKLLKPWQGANGSDGRLQAAARFRFEAQAAAHLSRKTRHIVQVTDYGEEAGTAYLVMELLEGMTLETKLLQSRCLPSLQARQVVTQVARALEHAHAEGVLHRDLKPSNVFLTRNEDAETLVKVLDFGIARVMHDHLTRAPSPAGRALIFGTPGYMSPEQARGQASLDGGCDLWALATIAYEALTNQLPVAGYTADELLRSTCAGRTMPLCDLRPDLPPAVGAFFERAFADKLRSRFSCAADLSQAFDEAWRGARVPAPRAPKPGARRL
jgi:serine/threonine protein kinase